MRSHRIGAGTSKLGLVNFAGPELCDQQRHLKFRDNAGVWRRIAANTGFSRKPCEL